MPDPRRRKNARFAAAAAAATALSFASAASAQNVSAPAILQWFDGSYATIERRTPDYFMAGYGGLWTPPSGRADSGDGSVGYDVYDRFDLGQSGRSTQYGTESGLKTMIAEIHKGAGRAYLDLVWNHNGFSQWGTTDGSGHTFLNAGGYPGFYMSSGNGSWGDFHDPSASGDENMQLAGLIDVDQSTNNQFIRSPVTAGNAQNLPAGTQSAFGRLANVPTAANLRFYPSQTTNVLTVNDPALGQSNVPIYNFNTANPNDATPTAENATGYLMRNTRWLIQDIGADGFRLDATKNMPDWVLKYLDHAVYKAIQTPLLDGSTQNVWSFGENFDTNFAALQSRVRLDVNSQPANTVGGNRDTLDFPLYYAMQSNLSGNGLQNDWRNVVNSSFDIHDDGLANNGSQGVAFVQSHDASGSPPYLSNVAYAYTLLRPGNAIVYFNGNEFGTRGNNFPQQGRGDALGGFYGDAITTLVGIRNSYGRGNYLERWLDKETLVYERENSVIAGYNNRIDNGYDQRTVQTAFAAGTHLLELTGNATDPSVDPNQGTNGGDIYDVVTVAGNGQITIRIPRNKNLNGLEHDKGYVMYGPATPRGSISVTNVAKTLASQTPTANTNGTARLTPIDVVKTNSFDVNLATIPVILPDLFHDIDADGDNALLRVDGGLDLNANGHVDHVTPDSTAYGFEEFTTKHSPLFGGGDGQYIQTVDSTQLSEGYHYITARAFRHRASGPAIYQDFKKVVYVDRLRPVSAIDSLQTISGHPNDRDVVIRSTDKTATAVSVFYNIGASQFTLDDLTNMGETSQTPAGAYDRDLFKWGVSNWQNGNNSVTVVTYEITYDPTQDYAGGGVSVQRFNAVGLGQGLGSGLGDLDFSGSLTPNDPNTFGTVLASNNTSFNPAGDLNADGLVDEADDVLMVPWLTFKNANVGTITTATNLRLTRAIALDGTLDVPGGTLNVSGTAVPGVPLTFTNSFNIPAGRTITKTGSQTLTINGPQSNGANSTLAIAAGTANINTDGGTNLAVTVSGAGSQVNFGATQTLRGVSVDNGSLMTLPIAGPNTNWGGKTLSTRSLAIAAGGKLDAGNNNLLIDYVSGGPDSPLASVQSLLATGRNGGGWNGSSGMVSSAAAATAGLTALGVAEASDVLGLSGSATALWAGVTADSTSVLVKYTYAGDATLDGKINVDDYGRIDFSVNLPGVSGWFNGDFNYDGKINVDDYGIIDFNVALQGAPISSVPGVAASPISVGLSSVPEPTALGISCTCASTAFLKRRRHKAVR